MKVTDPIKSTGWLGGAGYQVIDVREESTMPLWEVTQRYVVEETFRVEANTREEAIYTATGASDPINWERIREFAPKVKRLETNQSS